MPDHVRCLTLSNKTALVTGGSGVIGRAIALKLGLAGARIAVGWHTNAAGARETLDILQENGINCIALQADVGTRDGPQQLVVETEAQFGPIHILTNNAGTELYELLIDTPYDDAKRVIDTNLLGAYLCAKHVLPGMMARGWGRIINIGSVWGEVGGAGETAYSAAKAGLTGFTKALAKEVALTGVTVNAVAPGVIDTPMVRSFDNDDKEALLRRIPTGRFGQAEDVAGAALFLTSDEASYVTGHVLWVTGGFDPLP